jgi:hypothetical protein
VAEGNGDAVQTSKVRLGITTLDDPEAGPVPTMLVAVTVNEYWSPLVSPLTMIGLVVPVAVGFARVDLDRS